MFHTIIHLSDTHIRAGNKEKSRYDEYHCVFQHTIESIKEQPTVKDKSAVIVITGDLFHHKNKIEPCSLELAIYLLHGLSSLAHVFIIRGNHDYRQDVPNETDTIRALMSYDIPNVTYLDTTGIHTFQNISFGLVAIQDTLLYGATAGICQNLPPYPKPSDSEYNIALFHGSITNSSLQNGTNLIRDGYPIGWFQGYDAILLGDIHLQQIHRANPIEFKSDSFPHSTLLSVHEYENEPWAYPGSLIQQDFGEPVKGHGYLVWDLKQKRIKAYHVHNPFGFIKIKNSLDPNISKSWFPKYLKITGHFDSQIKEQLQSHGKQIVFIKESIETNENENETKDTEIKYDIQSINSMDSMIDYIDNVMSKQERIIPKIWKSWLKHPETMLISHTFPDKISLKVDDRTDKIHKAILKFQDEFERMTQHTIHGKLHLHQLEWNWILNFKDQNRFNFDQTANHISILNAKNGCGKSNFLEIICISLYGEGFPSRTSKQYSAGIICDKKPKGVMANTTIIFSIHDKKYKLYRVMRPNSDQRSINFEKVVLSLIEDTKETIVHQQKNAVHAWIETNIGSIDTYLMTAMLSQNADKDFFSLEKSIQKELLDKILSLQHITTLQSLLKETVKYYKYVYELI
jgi:DNA repair exonuclease SbcCD nuclease subunit